VKYHCFALLLFLAPAAADDAATNYGRKLAQDNCAICHATATSDLSPLADAPPFRDIALSYDSAELEDALNEGVATEHPAMPDWQMTPDEAHALASFIMSLGPAGKLKSESVPGTQLGVAASP
jgi:cytochrome c